MSANTTEVADILNRIALLETSLTYGGAPLISFPNASIAYPNIINPNNDGPIFVNFPATLIENKLISEDTTGREFEETRQFWLSLHFATYGSGEAGEVYNAMLAYFGATYVLFGAYPKLQQLPGIRSARLINDTGTTQTLKYAGHDYYGIRFTLQVVNRTRRLLAADE